MRSNSISSLSSATSRSSDCEDTTMQIFVRDVRGETFAITVPQSISVGNLRSLLALRTNTNESELRLVFAGRHLTSPTALLSEYNISRESLVHLALPIRGGVPKRMRCAYKECKEKIQPIVGDCGFCPGAFCAKHRMLESHDCPGLEEHMQQEKARNRSKLESERTMPIKGI